MRMKRGARLLWRDGAAIPFRGQVQRGNTWKQRLLTWRPILSKSLGDDYTPRKLMEQRMRTAVRWTIATVAFAAVSATSAAHADRVPPFKGNDTGGIIAYALQMQGTDVRAIAVNHCARYGKVVKLTGVDAQYGGYISFACVWVPPGSLEQPLRAAY
jgi:hypothetical protein